MADKQTGPSRGLLDLLKVEHVDIEVCDSPDGRRTMYLQTNRGTRVRIGNIPGRVRFLVDGREVYNNGKEVKQ